MAAAAGPVRYLYLRQQSSTANGASRSWPPPNDQLAADDVVCASVQLVATEQGWAASALDHIPALEEIPDGALVLTSASELGFTAGRPDSAVSVLGVRVEEAAGPTMLLTHLVVQAADGGGLERRGTRAPSIVPAQLIVVTNYEERGGRTAASLDLRMAPSELGRYPVWLPDAAILPLALDAVDQAVPSPRARHGMTLEVHCGRVALHGRVEIVSSADAAIAELERTQGVVDVANYLLIDETLQDAVEQALAAKGITQVRALAEHGLISLYGRVLDRDARYAAQDVAAKVTGVRGVVNQIAIADYADRAERA